MKIWFKIWENTHLLKSETIEDNTEDTRTHKIFHALEEVCLKWDLGKPIWFDANIAEFQRHARTRFGKDNLPGKARGGFKSAETAGTVGFCETCRNVSQNVPDPPLRGQKATGKPSFFRGSAWTGTYRLLDRMPG